MDDDDIKFMQMQDEMSRFEAEISEERAPYRNRDRHERIPPPPQPPTLLLPSQVQKSRLAPPPSFSSFSSFDEPSSPTGANQPVVVSGAPQLYKKPEKIVTSKEYSAVDISNSLHVAEVDRSFMPVIPIVPPKPVSSHHSSSSRDSHKAPKKEKKNRKTIRTAGGSTWEDQSLLDWPEDDFRLFCGDLGNDVTDELLSRTFSKYGSFSKAKVIRDKRTNKSKGFGFISFREPADFIKAMKEMNGRYVGSRPIKLRKSTWKARSLDTVRKKEKEKAALISLLTGGPKKGSS